MSLEAARDFVRGVLLLVFAGIAIWGDGRLGGALVAAMGALILQSAFSGWCPADVILRPLGVKGKRAARSAGQRLGRAA